MSRRARTGKASTKRKRSYRGRRRQMLPAGMAFYPVPHGGLGFGVKRKAFRIPNLILHVESGYCVDPKAGQVYGVWGLPIGSVCKDGYVRLGKRPGITHTIYAHRLIWEAVNGPIPHPLQIDHKDAKRANNRIANLQLLTASENVLLTYTRGGRPTGAQRPGAKLTERQVRRIRSHSHLRNADFARLYGVDPSTIRSIRTGKTWKHLRARKRRPASKRKD